MYSFPLSTKITCDDGRYWLGRSLLPNRSKGVVHVVMRCGYGELMHILYKSNIFDIEYNGENYQYKLDPIIHVSFDPLIHIQAISIVYYNLAKLGIVVKNTVFVSVSNDITTLRIQFPWEVHIYTGEDKMTKALEDYKECTRYIRYSIPTNLKYNDVWNCISKEVEVGLIKSKFKCGTRSKCNMKSKCNIIMGLIHRERNGR